MKKHVVAAIIAASTTMLTMSRANAVVIDTYFGWNFVGADIYFQSDGSPIALPNLSLNSITYIGAGGTTTQAMPDFPGYGSGMPDGEFISPVPTYTTSVGGDGETTRTIDTALPIDWVAAGVTTPWGTYTFPTINITGITAFGVTGTLTSASDYVVGLIPFGADTELSSTLGGAQADIYETSRIILFSPDPLSGIAGTGGFTFSAAAASPVPIPAAVWLFGSGFLGLVGMARRKNAA